MTADIDEFAKRFVPPAGARTIRPDGSIEFVCTDCGWTIHMAVDDGCEFPVCATCRWFGERPWLKQGDLP